MVTIEQIAALAGVTPKTVSNVLNRTTPEKRPSARARAEKIREIARRLNYRPNAAARAIVTGRFGTIGLFQSLNPHRGNVFPSTWRAIALELAARDLHLALGVVPEDKLADENYVPKILREWSIDGLIVNYNIGSPPVLGAMVRKYRIPCVWMNGKFDANCVYPDDATGAARGVEYLRSLGHRRIAYVNHLRTDHYSTQDRRTGYLQAMTAAGLVPQVLEAERELLDWDQLSAEWLSSPDRPTAMLCYEFNRFLSLYCTAIRLGLRVPEDLSLLTFRAWDYERLPIQPDTLHVPTFEMGKAAVELITTQLEGNIQSLPPRPLPANLVPGRTCAPLR